MGERWAALVVNNEAEESQLFWAEIWQRGQMLHDDVFGSDATLQRHYIAARAAVALGHEDDFLLRFVGPRWHLGIPFELLHERGTGTLATRYALCRSVLGARNRKSHSLALRHELKVLVIASPSRSGAMLEAREIARVCASGANVKEVKLISTREVTWDEVVKHLSRCRYDIVHIAAAGRFDAAAPDESALLLPTNVAATEMKPLTASQIGQLLEGSVTDLFFASADYSAATGGREFLAHCDYLGVMDALVFAGIPCIVGYRWAVTDDGAREAAIRFYERLLIEGSPARALRHARHEGYVERGHDATHLGLVLVATEDTDDPISDMEGRRRGG
jgi:CHAT domain-containing protein